MDRIKQIKTQLEYYLSDKNLEKDKFFHEKISSDAEGYLDIEHILNCNKIKEIKATNDEIVAAAKSSLTLEVDSENKKIKRKENTPLPELKLLNKKKTKSEEKEEKDSYDYIILQIDTTSDKELSWKDIQHEFKSKNPELVVSYLRFKGKEGNIGIHQKKTVPLVFEPTITVSGETLTIKKCEGEDLLKFWENHGSHFEMCVAKGKDRKKGGGNKYSLGGDVMLGDELFNDATMIKARTRKILASANDKLDEKDEKIIIDLLQYHKDKESVLDNIDHIEIGKEDESSYSKGYYVVKKDGSKMDVNIPKCIEYLTISSNKKKNNDRNDRSKNKKRRD